MFSPADKKIMLSVHCTEDGKSDIIARSNILLSTKNRTISSVINKYSNIMLVVEKDIMLCNVHHIILLYISNEDINKLLCNAVNKCLLSTGDSKALLSTDDTKIELLKIRKINYAVAVYERQQKCAVY